MPSSTWLIKYSEPIWIHSKRMAESPTHGLGEWRMEPSGEDEALSQLFRKLLSSIPSALTTAQNPFKFIFHMVFHQSKRVSSSSWPPWLLLFSTLLAGMWSSHSAGQGALQSSKQCLLPARPQGASATSPSAVSSGPPRVTARVRGRHWAGAQGSRVLSQALPRSSSS